MHNMFSFISLKLTLINILVLQENIHILNFSSLINKGFSINHKFCFLENIGLRAKCAKYRNISHSHRGVFLLPIKEIINNAKCFLINFITIILSQNVTIHFKRCVIYFRTQKNSSFM